MCCHTTTGKRSSTPLTDAHEELSKCPYTGDLIPITELVSPGTKNDIPFCVVTGRHMVKEDWCVCPVSKLPALYSKYVEYLNAQKEDKARVDPMCGAPVAVSQLVKIDDPEAFLTAFSQSPSREDEEDEEE